MTWPGEYLADELAERGLTVAQFAELSGLPVETVMAVVYGAHQITAPIAGAIAGALGTTPEMWLALEHAGRGTWSVHDQPDFERVYTEDDQVTIRCGDLRALLDLAVGSMDFGSGFLDNEQAEVLRKAAVVLGLDPLTVTPRNLKCVYTNEGHVWRTDSQPGLTDITMCERCGRLQ